MSRVGRWDEPCKRIIAGEIDIINKESAFANRTKPNKFNNGKAFADKVKDMDIRRSSKKRNQKQKKRKRSNLRQNIAEKTNKRVTDVEELSKENPISQIEYHIIL